MKILYKFWLSEADLIQIYHTHSLVSRLSSLSPLFLLLFSFMHLIVVTISPSRSKQIFSPASLESERNWRQEDEAFVSHLWWRPPEVESRARRKEGEVKGGGLLSFIGREARARCDLVRSRCGSSGNQLIAQWFCGCGILETLDLGQGCVVG